MNGKYYWLKLKKDFFKRHDIRILESMPNGEQIVLFYLKLMLESVDHDGELRFSEEIPYSPEMLSTITGTDADIVNHSLEILQKFRMIEISDDETIILPKVESMIGFETEWAKKKRAWREQLGQTEDNARTNEGQIEDNVLEMSSKCPQSKRTLSDKSKSKSKSKSKREIYKEKSSLSEILESVVPDDRLKKAFREFIEMREKIKSPLTENALRLAIKKASDLSGGDIETAVAVVEQSVLNDWKGLYALKQPTGQNNDWFADYYQKYGQEGDAQ